jgi:hypothetical protein
MDLEKREPTINSGFFRKNNLVPIAAHFECNV